MQSTSQKNTCCSCAWSSLGLLVLFLFFAFVLFCVLKERPSAQTSERAVERAKILENVQKQANEKLAQAAWIDKEKRIVRLPIERAMKLTMVELSAKPVAAGSVIKITPTAIVPLYLQPALPPVPSAQAAASASPATTPPSSSASAPPSPSVPQPTTPTSNQTPR